MSSTAGRLVIPVMGPYCASKFALEAMAEALRRERAPLGVESTVIEPGAYPTPILGKPGGGTDTERSAGYGPSADLAGQLQAGLSAALSGPDSPDPNEVADRIAVQVEAAPGTLRFRTRVGADTAPLRAFGLGAVAESAAAAYAA